MSQLEQDTKRMEQVKTIPELDVSNNNKEYKVEAIWDSIICAIESELGYLPRLYYLIAWKSYPEEENIWEPVLAVQYLRKLISSFHKDHPKKPIATFLLVNSAPLMAGPIIKPMVKSITKRKQDQLVNSANKQAKKK